MQTIRNAQSNKTFIDILTLFLVPSSLIGLLLDRFVYYFTLLAYILTSSVQSY